MSFRPHTKFDEEELEQIEETPMGDNTIREYLPDAKIIKYDDLNDLSSIEELLPSDKSYVIMLVEHAPNSGHWIALSKYGDKVEHFCSYGSKPDEYLKWNNASTNDKLGQGKKQLSSLLNNYPGEVVYNPIEYQQDASDVQTCGRHDVYRVKKMLDDMNLDAYYQHMKEMKNKIGGSYDDVVASIISSTN